MGFKGQTDSVQGTTNMNLLKYRHLKHRNALVIWKEKLHGQWYWLALLKDGLILNGCGAVHVRSQDELFQLLGQAKKGEVRWKNSYASRA